MRGGARERHLGSRVRNRLSRFGSPGETERWIRRFDRR